jgi:microcystin-dependent protein
MSYQVRFTETNNPSKATITVDDQTLNGQTSVTFVGKNYAGYAQVIAENFLHLLENFANASAPSTPVQGQIWFDNSASVNQLKVWDGVSWASTGGVKKSDQSPSVGNAIKGDLWVDTTHQQLFLYNGSSWILVGPSFSAGAKTGPQIEIIVDLLDQSNSVITFWVNDERTAILAKDAFTPKGQIPGFTTIKKGFNLNSLGDYKYYGTAEKAQALVINNITVDALNFLRSDQASTTNYQLNIRNDGGLTVGGDLSFALTTESGVSVIRNKNPGSSIDFKVNTQGTVSTVVRIDSSKNVGINKTNPAVALDVAGAIASDTGLTITGTTDATTLNAASVIFKGGAAITKKLLVGDDTVVSGQIYVDYKDANGDPITAAAILPNSDAAAGLYDIGTPTRPFKDVYATTYYGNFSGAFTGSLADGTVAGSAASLSSTTNFVMTGDVLTTVPLPFNGVTATGTATFNTVLSQDFITSKTLVGDSNDSDVFIMYRPNVGLRKIAKSTFFSTAATVPLGAIMPYAGIIAPKGWLLCDGGEVTISKYAALFGVIGYTYKDISLLIGYGTFALPDLRGRFALGRDDMDNGNTVYSKESGAGNNPISINAGGGQADRVTDMSAKTMGTGSGGETTSLDITNIPEHVHTLKGKVGSSTGNQYYAMRNVSGAPPDTNAISGFGATAPGQGQYLTDSGGIQVPLGTQLGSAFNVMNPYATINYIIYTGVTS